MMLKAHRFKLRRIAALMLVMVMIVANMPPGKAVVSDVIANDNPDLTAIVVATDKASKVEIGFSVKSGAGSFKAAAMVLKYDAKLLTPIDWEQTPLPIPINEITNVAGTTAEEKKLSLVSNTKLANDPWSVATNVKAMSSPDFSVREAKAFVDGTAKDGAKVGYLCLNAMMPRSAVVNLPLPGEIPVTPGNPDAIPPVAPVNQPSVSLTPQGGATPSKTPNGLIKLMDAEPQKTAVNQAVVARFEVNIDPQTKLPYTLEQVTASIDIVNDAKDDAILGAGDPLKAVAKTSPASDASGAWYLRDDATPEALTTVTKIDPYLLSVPKGASINEGGGDPANFAPIVFYDWDESMLGSTLINTVNGADATQIAEILAAFEMMNKSQSATNIGIAMPTLEPIYDGTAPQKKLTFKKGYNFAGWVQVTGETLASTFTAYKTDADFQKVKVDPTKLNGSTTLKAAYVENNTCNVGGAFYTTNEVEFNRYGLQNAGIFSMTVKINREFGGAGVTRLRRPALKVGMINASGIKTDSIIFLTNIDETTCEIVTSAAMDLVEYTVIDASENPDWVNFCGAISAKENEAKGTASEKDGFVFKGSLQYVIEKAIDYNRAAADTSIPDFDIIYRNWNSNVNANTLQKDIGFIYTSAGVADHPGQTPPNYAKAKLRTYKYFIKNGANALDGKSYQEKFKALSDAMWDNTLDVIPDNRKS